MDPGPLALPRPVFVSEDPQILTLEKLISSKLSTYIGRGIQRAQDYADVVKLTQLNQLPREFSVDAQVQERYRQTWDEIHNSLS